MKTPKLPEFVVMGPFKVFLRLVSHVLDENIMAMESETTFNLLVHELFHLCYYQYNLDKDKDEEVLVNAYANFTTELLTRSNLKEYLTYLITKKTH